MTGTSSHICSDCAAGRHEYCQNLVRYVASGLTDDTSAYGYTLCTCSCETSTTSFPYASDVVDMEQILKASEE